MKTKPIKFSYLVLSMIGMLFFTNPLIGDNLDMNDSLNKNNAQQKILEQLEVSVIDRYDDFISQQIYPKNRDLTIWFVPRSSDDGDSLSGAYVV